MKIAKGRWLNIFKSKKNGENQRNSGDRTVNMIQKESDSMTQCPTSMALLFILSLVAILVSITEGFIIFYHSMIFAQCKFSLITLGLGQADLIYHGIFIMAPIYQLALYLDALRQRNIIQLFTLILFGMFEVKVIMCIFFLKK